MNRFFLLLLIGSFGLSACDVQPDTTAPNLHDIVPQLSGLTYSPKNIVFENLPESQRNGLVANVPVQLSVAASDLDGSRLSRVQYTLYQFNGQVLKSGEMTLNGNRYTATPTLTLNKADVGTYTLKVQGVDEQGNFSNFVFGAIQFLAQGAAPVLVSVNAPAQIQLPAAGSTRREKITATVTDPDGLSNVAKVVMRALDGSEFELLDDGGRNSSLSGDTTAGDGIFTITIEINSSNPTGTFPFDFEATDRTGLRSNIISKIIQVIP